MNFKLLFPIFLFSLSSCSKELEIIETPNNSLVINSIITPDSLIKVNISKTALMNENPLFIEDAKVKLYKNDTFIQTLNYNKSGWYKSSAHPIENQDYSIKLDYNSLKYQSQTQIPSKVTILAASIEFTGNYNEYQEPISNIQVKFSDITNIDNYYELIIFNNLENKQIIGYYNFYNMNEPVILNEGDWAYEPSTLFFSDELFNGDTITLSFSILGMPYCETNDLYVELRTVSSEYYLYRKYWTRHFFNQQNDANTDDPLAILFQGEPIEMYSNIDNGYGIFAGYSTDIKLTECTQK